MLVKRQLEISITDDDNVLEAVAIDPATFYRELMRILKLRSDVNVMSIAEAEQRVLMILANAGFKAIYENFLKPVIDREAMREHKGHLTGWEYIHEKSEDELVRLMVSHTQHAMEIKTMLDDIMEQLKGTRG